MASKAVAGGVAADHVATVLMALDGRDETGVKAILKKATPDPLPRPTHETKDAIRIRFSEAAAVYSTPSGGINTVMEPARRQHQSALFRAAGGTVAAVAAVALAGWFGLSHLPKPNTEVQGPTASASPTAPGVAVRWDPEPAFREALTNFHYPLCGEEFAPVAKAVGGVTPVPAVHTTNLPQTGEILELSNAFTSGDGEATALLAAARSYVITKDDVVVFSGGTEFYGMNFYTANAPSDGSGISLSPIMMCDGQEATSELYDATQDLSDAEQTAAQDELFKKWSTFKAGTYKIYFVTPMVFGEQAALAGSFARDGVTDTAMISLDISYSSLTDDPRLATYCFGEKVSGDIHCSPPADVLADVLTRRVDPASVNNTQPGVGVSEPLEYVVPGRDAVE